MSWLRGLTQKAESRLEQHLQQQYDNHQQTSGAPTPQNETLFQAFEWHTPSHHWTRLSAALPSLADVGVTAAWLPPGCKANDPKGNGYDCYDLWDLGEFDQKWTRRTKWGSREELNDLIGEAKSLGVKIIWDAVLNHKTAGDSTEDCWAVEVDPCDRRIETSKQKQIQPWIHYNFPGRGDTYSSLKWHWYHFNGTDWCQRAQRNAIYKIVDPPESAPRPGMPELPAGGSRKGWAQDVDSENGNADYLMFSNVDHRNPEVREDLVRWGQWMVQDVGVDGFRLDAVPHYSWNFTKEWIAEAKKAGADRQREVIVFGEYWMKDVTRIVQWVDNVGQGVRAFDACLHTNFARLSQATSRWEVDLRKVYRDTLTAARPDNAITMITSHDTQAGQAMSTDIGPFFKPLAYAIMLLRKEGLPCVFYGDLYGTSGPKGEPPACWNRLPALMLSRKRYAYGNQTDYFDSRTCIGWTRQGTWDRKDGCAVVMSIAGASKLRMFVGQDQCGQKWTDVLDNVHEAVVVDEKGFGMFTCSAKAVSVWVRHEAEGRNDFAAVCNADNFRL